MATSRKPTVKRASAFGTSNRTAAFNPPRATFNSAAPARTGRSAGPASTFGSTSVPGSAFGSMSTGLRAPLASTFYTTPSTGGKITVRRGDSLWSIAKKLNGTGGQDNKAIQMKVDELIRKNKGHLPGLAKNPNSIKAGMQLSY